MRVMLRQMRCSPFGTKLKINSSAISRRTNRSASLKSCLRPRGARLEKACAKCKSICGSNSNHTVRQYCAVDSMTASRTPCSRNQLDRRRRSLGKVVNRRRSGFSTGEVASINTTIKTFLCTSIPAILYPIAFSWRGQAERAKESLHTLTCYHPSRQDEWRDTDWFHRTFQIKLRHGLALSRV